MYIKGLILAQLMVGLCRPRNLFFNYQSLSNLGDKIINQLIKTKLAMYRVLYEDWLKILSNIQFDSI